MTVWELDTPALLIDQDILTANLKRMQAYAERKHVLLRPHVKTHKMPHIARLQRELGAVGIAVAKVGEAEVMAEHGMDDIMIANEIVGPEKLRRIAALGRSCRVRYGVDSVYQIEEAQLTFAACSATARVVVEIEVGENRSGVVEETDFRELIKAIQKSPNVSYEGVFGHDGNSYRAADAKACTDVSVGAQRRLLQFASVAEEMGEHSRIVSYGSTPAVLCDCPILEGITDIRVGTYALMDASQAHVVGTYEHCGATVLATVISKPVKGRVILDVGAKGLTMQERTEGICASGGKGCILGEPDVKIDAVFDEHGIIHDERFFEKVRIGEKVRIIPAHVCPVVNLYDSAYFCEGETVISEVPVLCRGKLN
mgnify:CR=1 FL=1